MVFAMGHFGCLERGGGGGGGAGSASAVAKVALLTATANGGTRFTPCHVLAAVRTGLTSMGCAVFCDSAFGAAQ